MGPSLAPLKVGIYNIHGGVDIYGRSDLSRIARVIQTAAPEIMGLNEVNRYLSGDDQDSLIASKLGTTWTSVFAKTINKPLAEYGNAILTCLPVISSETWLFTQYPNQEARGMVRLTVLKDGRPVHVFCTHMGLKDEMRRRHAAEILLILSRFADAPRILMGDFNEGRGSAGVDAISKQYTDIWGRYGMGPGKTFSSVAPFRRIDFIWTDKELAATSCYVARFPEAAVASDHLPVFANLVRPLDPQPIVREVTEKTNGKQVLPGTPGAENVDLDPDNATVKILHPVYAQSLIDINVGKAPSAWIQLHRSAGVTPFAGVTLIGIHKLWHQRSEQHLSFHHALTISPPLTDVEVSARVKTMTTGGGEWRLGVDTSSSQNARCIYSIEVNHDGRHPPRLRLMAGKRELENVLLPDFHIDPYDWNNYALALAQELSDSEETVHSLIVYVNGRRIAEALDVDAGGDAESNSIAVSVILTTAGRHDTPCQIYAENVMVRQSKTVQEASPASEFARQITIRSFPPNTSIIETHFEPSTRWRGFF